MVTPYAVTQCPPTAVPSFLFFVGKAEECSLVYSDGLEHLLKSDSAKAYTTKRNLSNGQRN